MEKKITRKKVSKIAQELEKTEWMKNPMIYSQVSADMTLMQREIIISVAASLQDRIGEYLQRRRMGSSDLSLFSEEELNRDVYEIRISTKELNVRPDAYDELDAACDSLSKMNFSYTSYNEKELCYEKHYTSLFSDISFPIENNRRQGYIKVQMLTQNMKALFDMRNGYVEHLRRIVPLCRKKNTPPLYIYLSKYKNFGHKLIPFTDLKGYLNDYEFDGTGKLVKDKNPKFNQFCLRVLDPVKTEMDKLASEGKLDFTFTYEARYKNGARRGNPDSMLFKIVMSDMGINHLHKQEDKLVELLLFYSFTSSEIKHLFENKNLDGKEYVYKALLKQKEKIESEKVDNRKGYIYKMVVDLFHDYEQNIVKTATEIVESSVKPIIENGDIYLWDEVWAGMTDANSELHIWREAVTLYSVDDKTVTIAIPTNATYEIIIKKFGTLIQDRIGEKFGKRVEVRIEN